MPEYLKLDSTRLSFGEYWRWKPGIPFLILAGRKLLGWPFRTTVAVPASAAVDVVDPRRQPQGLVAALAEPIRACEERGRKLEFWYTVPTIGRNVGLAAALAGDDGLSVALAIGAEANDGARRDVVLGLASRLRDGRFLGTGAGKLLFDPPPEVTTLRIRGASFAQLVEAHDSLVDSRRSELMPCGDTRRMILELQQLQINANVARHVYVPASAQDVAMLEEQGRRRRTIE